MRSGLCWSWAAAIIARKLIRRRKMLNRFVFPVAVLCLISFAGQTVAQLGAPGERKGSGMVVLKASQIIDGTGAAPIRDGAILITDDKISAIGPLAAMTFPAGTRVIDLGDATVMPGFIDSHTHIIGRVLGDSEASESSVHDYDSFGAILGVGSAER